jgi:Ca-activated chloride channel family protein
MRIVLLALTLALSLAPAAAAQQGTPIVGGGSFNTAPLLEPGSYTDTVAAGETVYWKIKLQKGQILRVRATVDTSEVETDLFAGNYLEGIANLGYRLYLFTPLRERVSDEFEWRDGAADLEGDDSAGAKTGEAVTPRVLGYEQILGPDFNLDKYPAPGEWFIALSAADSDTYPAEIPAELPIGLEVGVEGTAEPSSPDFAAKLPGPTPEPTASAESLLAGDADAGDPALTIALVGLLCLLGGLGLGALASRLLVSRP